jgi:hypothetical protein
LVVTPDGRHAVSASRDNTLKAWDIESGRELQALSGHNIMSPPWQRYRMIGVPSLFPGVGVSARRRRRDFGRSQ